MTNEMESLLDAFLYETNGLLDNLERILMKDEAASSLSSEDINEIFRIMHTTKSSSAMIGYNSVSVAAHRIEDLFSYIRDKNDGLNFIDDTTKKDLFNLLFAAEDYLRTQMLHIENGTDLDEDIDDLIASIYDMLERIKGEPVEKEELPKKKKTEEVKEEVKEEVQDDYVIDVDLPNDENAKAFIHITLEKNIMMENLRAFMIATNVKEGVPTSRYYPTDMDSNNDRLQEIIDHGFFIAFDSLEDASAATTILEEQPYVANFKCVEVHEADAKTQGEEEAEVEEVVTIDEEPVEHVEHTEKKTNNIGPVKQNLISVSLSKLDELNNLVGEIVITESMVTSSPALNALPTDALDEFFKSARQLRKLTDDLQDIAMSLRMVPIAGVFQKMSRVVRDMKNKLDKPVHLTIIGEDTEVDKSIVDAIQDPVLHLVRNCMDHGIENSVEERIAAGKSEEGEITISATHTSSEIIISVSDDGYGMDTDKILNKAERMGLLTKERERYSRNEILNLILLPGFSTNSEVTEYSGRGVGMDVVRRNIESIGGSIHITSEYHEGTTFTFHIPLTLAIVDGMKVSVGNTIFTISIANIRQTFKATDEEIIRDEHNNAMVCRQNVFYPIVRLDENFAIEGKAKDYSDGIMLWVEANGQEFCLFADELIGGQQVVVKPLPQYLVNYNLKARGISGCTILGDGTISIILDIPSLYNAAFLNDAKENLNER